MRTTAALCVVCLLFTIGCTTSPQNAPGAFVTAALVGVVYDADGRPVHNALVSRGTGAGVRSDITGRFFLPDVPSGTVDLAVTHPDYVDVAGRLEFSSRTQVAYVRLERPDFEGHLRHAEQALLGGFFDAASGTLAELSGQASGQPDEARSLYEFLSAVCRFHEGNLQAAAQHLSAVTRELRGPAWNRLYELIAGDAGAD